MTWSKWCGGATALAIVLFIFLIVQYHESDNFHGHMDKIDTDEGTPGRILTCSIHSGDSSSGTKENLREVKYADIFMPTSPLIYPVPKAVILRKTRPTDEHSTGVSPTENVDKAVLTPASTGIHLNIHMHNHGPSAGSVPSEFHPSDQEWKHACLNLMIIGRVLLTPDSTVAIAA